MNQLEVLVNGETTVLAPGSTVADVVALVTSTVSGRSPGQPGAPDPSKGIAVAVDREVIPRSAWSSTPLSSGNRLEVVTAAAGG
jgi:sulfur carrier protein